MTGTPTERAIKRIESGKRLERLAADILKRDGYETDPTGTRGPDGGRDSILLRDGEKGILHCSIAHDWESKAKEDAESANDRPENFRFFVFATTRNPAGVKRDRVEEELREKYGWRILILDFERIRNRLVGNNRNHDLAKEHLEVDPGRAHRDVSEQVLQELRKKHAKIRGKEENIKAAQMVEELFKQLFTKTVPDVGVRKSQFFTSTSVYELILTNNSSKYPWRGMGPFVFADCKWRRKPLSVGEIRKMTAKAESLHPECSGLIIYSKSGVSDAARKVIRSDFQQGKYIIVFDDEDLERMLQDGYTDDVLEDIADNLWL